MDRKINCQIINILLNENNEFSNKYCSFSQGSYDFDNMFEDNFDNKNMRFIKIDNNNQSVCFTGQKDLISFYNQETRKNENYYEEIHIHCNDLNDFDNLVEFLYETEYRDSIDEVDKLPHYDVIAKGSFKDYDLIMQPMTNEVMNTRSLVKTFSQKSNELIFRSLAIYLFGLVDNSSQINSKLIKNLNNIYKLNVKDSKNDFFNEEITNQLLNISIDEKGHSRNFKEPTNNINLGSDYIINFNKESKEL